MKILLYFLPSSLYYCLLFYFSGRSHDFKVDILYVDKGIHFLEFAVLAVLIFFGYSKSLGAKIKVKAFLTFMTATLLAIADEIHQYFVPGRESDILDVAADSAGIIFGLFLFWYFTQRGKLKTLVEKDSHRA